MKRLRWGAAFLIIFSTGCAYSRMQPAASMTSSSYSAPANRLSREKSPYLLQHAHNPVDWYAWGEEAFAKAKQENKPIFLSIGYSTCHWCHVMERESFENPEIAGLLNRWFVCIKVDREEHPDVDGVYMSAVTAMTGQGGWPLTVFLTPELKPFFGGTYFPPEKRWQMNGMKELLPAVAEAWRARPNELIASAQRLTSALNQQFSGSQKGQAVTASVLDAAFNQAAAAFDESEGGFGQAPKFPRSHEMSFLLRYWKKTQTDQALKMVTVTLDHLGRGGIYDHLGGGFHRYSTDGQWLVPHFEKMLYDQALLAMTYLEAYRVTRNGFYAEITRGICDYVLRDLRDPQGGFYSAEDADSEGEEGKFYVWKPEEITSVLGKEEAALFNAFYGVTGEGNFEHNTSILHIKQPLEGFAASKGIDSALLAKRLGASRAKLFVRRASRIRPHRDDKVLTSWNGLMIAALAYAAATLDEPRYQEAAEQAARFVLSHLRQEGVLLRRYREKDARFNGTLEDYAFLSWGLFELYESTGEAFWLKETKSTVDGMIERFWDKERGGFFLKDQQEEPLIIQSKELYDGAAPSGNSVAAWVIVRLAHLMNDQRLAGFANKAIEAFGDSINEAPFGYPQMLSAIDMALGPSQELVIAGEPEDAGFSRLKAAAHRQFLPRTVIAYHGGANKPLIESLIPWITVQNPQQGRATAYLCEGYACRLPVTDADELSRQLLQPSAKPSRGS